MNWKNAGTLLVALALTNAAAAAPIMRITEWMYNGSGPGSTDEFVEFTNIGDMAADMNGWSFDDSSRSPGAQDLSAFGMVQPGESVLFTDLSEADFRTAWGLPIAVKVIGGNANNLGRADEINLYNGLALVDRLTYDDQNIGGPRTQFRSGNPTSLAALGANDPTQWILATSGDAYGSYAAIAPAAGDIGNPGTFAVPEPGTLALLVVGAFVATLRARRKS